MLTTYSYEGSRAYLRRVDTDEWELTRVWTPSHCRRKGWGNAVMAVVLASADREQVMLILTAGLGAVTGLSTEGLVEWYSRLGFDAISPGRYPGTTIMQRVPRSSVRSV